MKKLGFCLVLVILVTGVVFAQERPTDRAANIRNNWISGELGILGGGLRYERMLSENFSIGACAYANTLVIALDTSGIGAFARFYPFGKVLYLELGLGFGQNSGVDEKGLTLTHKQTGETLYWGGVQTVGFDIIPGFGWRFDVGQEGGFFLYPGVAFPITIGARKPWFPLGAISWDDTNYNAPSVSGANVSFRFYFGMGYAF